MNDPNGITLNIAGTAIRARVGPDGRPQVLEEGVFKTVEWLKAACGRILTPEELLLAIHRKLEERDGRST